MSNRGLIAITSILLTISASALAQSNIPADVKAKMNGFVGKWEIQEEWKSSPSADPEEVSGQWEARWVFDSLIQWRGTFSSADWAITYIEYEGYDSILQGYTYWFDSDGGRGQAFDGVWDGNTQKIQAVDIATDGTRSRVRCTWPYNNDFTAIVNFKCETLTKGSWWVSRTGNAKKVKSK